MYNFYLRIKKYVSIFILIVGGMILFLGLRQYSLEQKRAMLAENLKLELEVEAFELALASSNNMDGLTPFIKWWHDAETGEFYFFLPNSWKEKEDTFWVFSNAGVIIIDGHIVRNGDICDVQEGTYELEACDQKYMLTVLYSAEIPSMFMETESGSMAYVHESKEHFEPAEYVLFDKNGMINGAGEISELACRGNVTFTDVDKKSYRFKLKEKSQMLDMEADKDWILQANAIDGTLARNMIVTNLAKEFSMEYVTEMRYVDLYANGEYLGNYLLSERIEADSDRVNIRILNELTELYNPELDLSSCEQVIEQPGKLFSRKWWKIPNEPIEVDGGYLMEIELSDRYGLEESGFITSRMLPVVVHNPKYASLNQIGYIADLYQDFEDAVFSENGYNENTNKYFYDYIDMDSFATKYIVEELVKNLDASYTSFYLYKPEYDEKMYAGPVWDYDVSIGCERITEEGIDLADPEGLYAACNKREGDIWYGLYQQEIFREYVIRLWNNELGNVAEKIAADFVDNNGNAIVDSAIMNAIRWGWFSKGDTVEEKKDIYFERNAGLKTFLQERIEYLNEEWALTE